MLQGQEVASRSSETALRKQKTAFLKELISLRSEVGRQQSSQGLGPYRQLTAGEQARPPPPFTSTDPVSYQSKSNQ